MENGPFKAHRVTPGKKERQGKRGVMKNPRDCSRDYFQGRTKTVGLSLHWERYPKVGAVKRPANRPFAAYSSHDPEGHLFDLAQPDSQNIRGVWSEATREQDRYIKHVTIRAI